MREGRREVVTRAYGSSSHAFLACGGGPFVMPYTFFTAYPITCGIGTLEQVKKGMGKSYEEVKI